MNKIIAVYQITHTWGNETVVLVKEDSNTFVVRKRNDDECEEKVFTRRSEANKQMVEWISNSL